MFKRIFGLLALAFAFFCAESWACDGPCPPPPLSITKIYSPAVKTNTYDFTPSGDGKLIVTIDARTTFSLTATVNRTIDPISTSEFPAGTVAVTYANGQQDEYDFSGNSGGPNGVPVEGTDYLKMIDVELSYITFQTIHTPAFGHAPGDNATAVINENILEFYCCASADPTMGGKLPGLSTLAALDEPLTENDSYCWVSPMEGQTFTVGETIEVSFRLFASGPCTNNSGTPIRDKTATLSLSTTDTNGNTVSPPRLEKEKGNKFHWDNRNGLNGFDLSTEGLKPGSYTITVISSKFSPQSRDVTLTPSSSMVCLPLSSGVSCF